jgi:hypothetical protein
MASPIKPKYARHTAARKFSRRQELFGWAGCLGVIALALGTVFLSVVVIVALFKAADALLSWIF